MPRHRRSLPAGLGGGLASRSLDSSAYGRWRSAATRGNYLCDGYRSGCRSIAYTGRGRWRSASLAIDIRGNEPFGLDAQRRVGAKYPSTIAALASVKAKTAYLDGELAALMSQGCLASGTPMR